MTPDDSTDSVSIEEQLRQAFSRRIPDTESDLVLTQRETQMLLVMSAREYAAVPCEVPNCEACYEFVYTWKTLYQSLDASYRGAIEADLEHGDVRAPSFPQGFR